MGITRRRSARRPRGERGAVTLFMSVVLASLMVSGAFAVDLGMQRATRADLQAIADLVSMDLARQIDGRSVAQLTPVMATQSQRSLARNRSVLGGAPVTLVVDLGVRSSTGFTVMGSGTPSAVRVTARADAAFAFSGITGSNKGGADRSAVAESSSTACFRLGTFTAAVRSGDSTVLTPLNDLLGAKLDLLSYQGLANADLRLSQLVAASTLGTPEGLLTGAVNYTDLLQIMITALQRESATDNTVAISALTKIAQSSTAATVGPIHLGNVLHVAPSDRAALEVALSVLDIAGSARLADGQYFVGVPNIQANVPGVGFQFTGGLQLVSAAELACGVPNSIGATADTAQLGGTVGIAFTNLPSIGTSLGTLQTPKGTGSIVVDAGSGTGRLTSPPAVTCGQGTAVSPSTFAVAVSTGLASFKLNANITVSGDVKTSDLLGLGLTNVLTSLLGNILLLGSKLTISADVTLTVGASISGSTTTVGLSIPPNDTTPVSSGAMVYLDPATVTATVTGVTIGGKSAVVSQVTALTNLILPELVGTSKGFFTKSMTPLIDNINQEFIGPVARMIGLRLAGADVFAVGATCGLPRLAG